MFETLSDKLSGSLRKVRGRGRLTEENVSKTLNEVKMALLEADVNFRVVKSFLRSVKSRAVGEEVQGSLTPGQQFIKIVNEELTEMMGGANSGLSEPEIAPLITMLVGLQGSGKTSSAGKLARLYKTEGKRPYLIPADIYRPAAIQQLQVLADMVSALSQFKDKSAQAVCCLGYTKNGKSMYLFEGKVKGVIVKPRGSLNFGWDAIFQPSEHEQTFGEMDPEDKNRISPRGKAATKFKHFLTQSAKQT